MKINKAPENYPVIPDNLQIVNAEDMPVACDKCGVMLNLGTFTFTGIQQDSPLIHVEINKCNKCGTRFINHYNVFDIDGHINPAVYCGDPNDESYEWSSILSDEQRDAIAKHLTACTLCQQRRDFELLDNAAFADIIHSMQRLRNQLRGQSL